MAQAAPQDVAHEATEQTPLLPDVRYQSDSKKPSSEERLAESKRVFQLVLLCYARLMEPIAFFCIFPYIAEMVQRNGDLPDSDIGFYSGLLESAFSVTQVIFLMAWGCLADRIGRKPVLIMSLAGMAIGQILFGMSTSLWQMALFRSLTGVFSSANLVIRTMIGENSTHENRAKAFSWYSTSGNIAVFLGPLLGGLLVDPTQQYPNVFAGVPFVEEHPYALSGFLVGFMGFTAVVTSAMFLEETLSASPLHSSDDRDTMAESTQTTSQIMTAPRVPRAMLLFIQVMLLTFSCVAIFPIVLYTNVDIGGFGFSTAQSTMYITFQGISETVWLLAIFPALHRKVGTIGIIRLCAAAFPCLFAAHILMNALLRDGSEAALALSDIVVWMLKLLVPGVWMAVTAAQLRLNEVAPGPKTLGKINSVAELLASLVRATVPPVISTLFAIGVGEQIWAGYFAWVILIILSLPLLVTSLSHH